MKQIKTLTYHANYIAILYQDGSIDKVYYTSLQQGIDDKLLYKTVIVDSVHNIKS